MLHELLRQRFAWLQARGAGSWFAPLRARAWEQWCECFSVTDLPPAWVKELERASTSVATSAGEKAGQDARVMWRRLAVQAQQQGVAQQEGAIDAVSLPESSRAFLEARLRDDHPLTLLQVALLGDVWCVNASSGASYADPLQPPPALTLWDELFSFHAFHIGEGAAVEVVSGCMAPKGARALFVHMDLAARSRMHWVSMHHAPESDAECGTRHVHLGEAAHLAWHDVRLNAGAGLSTVADARENAIFDYKGLWGARTSTPLHLDWMEHVGDLWLIGNLDVPHAARKKQFRLPEESWPWRVVQVSEDVWREFCLEQFMLPFLQNLPVEYQTDVVRFAELSCHRA